MHTLLDLWGNIPTFIRITDGKTHDVNILDEFLPEPGAFYVMDRAYVNFERLFVFTGADHRRGLPFALAGGAVLQVYQAAFGDQEVLRHQRERREDPDLHRRLALRAGRDRAQ